MGIHAEISIVPITGGKSTSMGKQVAAAVQAIQKVRGVKATLTALGTQMEADSLEQILEAVSVAHKAARNSGGKRIISSIRIDERLDKEQSLDDKVRSVSKRLVVSGRKR